MFNKTKRIERLLRGAQFLLLETRHKGGASHECASILSKENEVLGESFYYTLINSDEVREFVLKVVSRYLSRYEVAQREFLESLK